MDPTQVAVLRDWVIVIFAALGILGAIVFIIAVLFIVRKVSPVLDSAKATMQNVKGTSSFIAETAIQPVVKIYGFAAGVQRTIGIITRLSKRKGSRRYGR